MTRQTFEPARTVSLWNESITTASVAKMKEQFVKILTTEKNTPIYWEINSSGGSCLDGYALAGWVRVNVPHLITIGYGQVSSMAAILFLMGERRIITEGCNMLLHPPAINFTGEVSLNAREQRRQIDELDAYEKQYLKLIMERLPSSDNRKKIKKLIGNSTTIWADKMLKLGFATERI